MELNEEDLDNIVGGIPYDRAVEIAKDHPELFRTDRKEMSEEELDNIKAGYPYGLDEENQPKKR